MLYWRQRMPDLGFCLSQEDIAIFTGVHVYDFFGIVMLVAVLASMLIGFLWIRPDANTRGQPGLLWALLTIPLNWVAVLGYLIVRAVTVPAAPR